MQCEEEYGVEFPSDDLENIKTVGDVIRYIKDQGIDAWAEWNKEIGKNFWNGGWF